MSQNSNHLKLVSWTWQWVYCTPMASTVTRSQFNRAPLGCGGTGDSHHGSTVWCHHVNMDQNLWGMNKELRQFWRQKGVPSVISKVYLIKWPVSVWVTSGYCFWVRNIQSFNLPVKSKELHEDSFWTGIWSSHKDCQKLVEHEVTPFSSQKSGSG